MTKKKKATKPNIKIVSQGPVTETETDFIEGDVKATEAEAKPPKKSNSKKAKKAADDVERQAKRYDEKAAHPATDIDRRPYFTPAMEREEERINREADERRANGTTDGEQTEMFPKATKEQIEEAAHVRSAKVKLEVTIELDGDKPIKLPLLQGTCSSDYVHQMCVLALNSRRNRRRFEAALDLPEAVEPTFTKSVKKSLQEIEAKTTEADKSNGGGDGGTPSGDAGGTTEPATTGTVPADSVTAPSDVASEGDSAFPAESVEAEPASELSESDPHDPGDVNDDADQFNHEPIAHVDTVDHEEELREAHGAF